MDLGGKIFLTVVSSSRKRLGWLSHSSFELATRQGSRLLDLTSNLTFEKAIVTTACL